jgi:hypothetical protein
VPLDESDQFPTEAEEMPTQESSELREPEAEYVAEPVPAPETPPEEPPQRASPATLEEAIEQVNRVVESLRQSLNDMEEVLELLEVLERQTGTDQQEIESLRRALRQFHRPPERSHHHRGRG